MRRRIQVIAAFVFCATGYAAPAETFDWRPIPAGHVPVEIGEAPFIQENSARSWSLQQAENSRSHALRFEVRAGDQWPDDQESGENKERSELDGYKTHWSGKAPVWVAYSFLIEPGAAYRSDWTAISQMHGSEVRPFFVLFKGAELSIVTERLGPSGTVEKQVYAGTLARGAWRHVVYELVQSSSDDGSLKVWLDGAPIVDYRGPIGSDRNEAYWKFGIYRGYGPIASPLAVDYANMEISQSDLSPRIQAPLPVQ